MEIKRNRRRNVPEDFLAVTELQRYLNLGRTKTYELIASREIPSYKIGHACGHRIKIDTSRLRMPRG